MGRQKAKANNRRRDNNNVVHLGAPFSHPSDALLEQTLGTKERRNDSPLEARNENQQIFLDLLAGKDLVFASGAAGCGKTYLSASWAAERLKAKEIDRIIVTRPVLESGENLGFLPGDILEKFGPYFRPVYDVLRERLGASFLEYCLKPEVGKVEIAPFAYMRGRNFDRAVVLLDEAQNATAAHMKMFLTRIGEDTQVIVSGDHNQIDLPGHVKSGLVDALRRFKDGPLVGRVAFTADDCVRSALCSEALLAYKD